MKKDIHPKLNTEVTVTCACGNSFVTSSTIDAISVEICSNCHPYYTGKQKFIDTEGRIDKFNKKREMAKNKASKKKKKGTSKKEAPKTLKDILKETK